MNRRDLDYLDQLILSPAAAVVSMRQVHEGATGDDVVGLRHDVDDNPGSLDTAVKLASWEAERGYRSTYYILHTASYFPGAQGALEQIAALGHEIGIHANAIAAALTTGEDPAEILRDALGQLRGWGHDIVGVAPHGDEKCRHKDGSIRFVNDEMFAECARPEFGAPDREIAPGLQLDPKPLADYGLAYETYRLPRGRYLSDSGGHWNVKPATVATGAGQLHVLQHPDWWAHAFPTKGTP